jgi:hypothetical protein
VAVSRHAAVVLSLLMVACGSPRLPLTDESSSTWSDSDSTTTTTETSTTERGFVPPNDQVLTPECDPFLQDCPDGEKCVPYASTGGTWDAFKCVPVTGEQATGEPCSYAGAVEASDDCDENGGCWSVQELEGEWVGTCHAFCQGSADDPECPEGSSCFIGGSGLPAYCIPTCDPVAQDCGLGLGCYFDGSDFDCAVSPQNIPAGEPCEFINDCAPGLVCSDPELLPTCNGASCCVLFCNLDLGDTQCDATPGTTCQPFYENDTAPPGYEHVGVCIVPGA